jgi:alpha-D-ribose 1-methylphosphonate 5-triphosphate diphosphatase
MLADLAVVGGTVHRPEGWLEPGAVVMAEGTIVDVTRGRVSARAVFDARDCLVLPGMVDVHCEALERHVAPRHHPHVDVGNALEFATWESLTWGVTTPILTVRLSSAAAWTSARECAATIALARTQPLHLRVELVDAEFVSALEAATPPLALVTINNHAANPLSGWCDDRYRRYLNSRFRARPDDVDRLVEICRRRPPDAWHRAVAAIAAWAPSTVGYHDAQGVELARLCAAYGMRYVEFPVDAATAAESSRLGLELVLGAPNVVRGGSHNGQLDAREAIGRRMCTVLCSDYHLPSLLMAPFALAAERILGLHEAWNLVSLGPARLSRAHDRGRIVEGAAADVVVVRPGNSPRIECVIKGGMVRVLRDPVRFANGVGPSPECLRMAAGM